MQDDEDREPGQEEDDDVFIPTAVVASTDRIGPNGGGGRAGDDPKRAGLETPFLGKRPISDSELYEWLDYQIQRTSTIWELLRQVASRKRTGSDRSTSAAGFRRYVRIRPLHEDEEIAGAVDNRVLYRHEYVPEDTSKTEYVEEVPAEDLFQDEETDLKLVRVEQGWQVIDGQKPDRFSRGQTGRNLIYKPDVERYFYELIEDNGLSEYYGSSFDDVPGDAQMRFRQLYWQAREYACKGPRTPGARLGGYPDWDQGAFNFGYIHRLYNSHVVENKEPLNDAFIQRVPSEYHLLWQHTERIARDCQSAVEGQNVREAIEAYHNMADLYSVIVRTPAIEKVWPKEAEPSVIREAGQEEFDEGSDTDEGPADEEETGEESTGNDEKPEGKPRTGLVLVVHTTSGIVIYCSIYEFDDDSKYIQMVGRYLGLRQKVDELTIQESEINSLRDDWFGSATRDQQAGTFILPGLDLDPRLYLGEWLGDKTMNDPEYMISSGPQVFMRHSYLLFRFAESARTLMDLAKLMRAGRLTYEEVERAIPKLVNWDMTRVWVDDDGNWYPEHAEGRKLLAMFPEEDPASSLDLPWLLRTDLVVRGSGDNFLRRKWLEKVNTLFEEMGVPDSVRLDTVDLANYGRHIDLAWEMWAKQPPGFVGETLDHYLKEARANRITNHLDVILERSAGFPGAHDGNQEMEEMLWERREDAFVWMEERMAEAHNISHSRQYRDFNSWLGKGMWQRIGDAPEDRMEGMRRLREMSFWAYMSAKAGDTIQGRAEAHDFRQVLSDTDEITGDLASRSRNWAIATGDQDREGLEAWKIADRYEIGRRLQDAGLAYCTMAEAVETEGVTAEIAEKIRTTEPDDPDDLNGWSDAWDDVEAFILAQLPAAGLTPDDIDMRMIRAWYFTFHDLLVD